ncbi:hypothetical protein [Helicobacter sp. 23-1045]
MQFFDFLRDSAKFVKNAESNKNSSLRDLTKSNRGNPFYFFGLLRCTRFASCASQ